MAQGYCCSQHPHQLEPAGSRIHVDNPAVEVGYKNGIGHMLEQLFRQLQPSGTPVEFAPEPLQFKWILQDIA